jgi:hypothetical protein
MHTPLDPVGSLDDSSSACLGRRIQHNRTVYSNEPVQTVVRAVEYKASASFEKIAPSLRVQIAI